MSSKVKVFYEGDTVEAEELAFTKEAETAARYRTSDGAVIDFRHTVKSIFKLCDKKKEDGSPIYIIGGEASFKTTQEST